MRFYLGWAGMLVGAGIFLYSMYRLVAFTVQSIDHFLLLCLACGLGALISGLRRYWLWSSGNPN
jgi:hypothetical protein